MDKLERFFKTNRKGFDTLKVDPDSWDSLEKALDQSAVEPTPPPARTKWPWALLFMAATILLAFALYLRQEQPPVIEEETPVIVAENEVGLEVNDIFPDIALRDPDGQLVSLSSMKGKIVLVELWASYSKICTEEHCYFFKPIYNQYRDKGFEIYAVSVDSSANNWIDAIESDQLEWTQVSDLKGYDSPMVELVFENQLPTTYLLDSDGRIIAKNIDSEDLEVTLSQLLAFN